MQNKTILITGASRGIGAAAARVFAEAGARVMLTARSGDAIEALAEDLTAAGHVARAQTCDVADMQSVTATVEACERDLGPVDVLINNAGLLEPIGPMATCDPDAWGKVIDVNIKGVYHGIRAVLSGMIARGGGTILTVGSGAAHNPMEGWAHYCTSKAGALMLTRAVDKEAGDAGVVSVNLSPGTVATQMQRDIKASGINPVSDLEWSDHIPPEWPARALLWLAGPDGQRFKGEEVSLRNEDIRREIGLID